MAQLAILGHATRGKEVIEVTMAQLAILGHATRGKEVIEILEMLGGKNIYNLSGDTSCAYYVLEKGEIRCGTYVYGNEPYTIFTIERFLEKFPYKVGDKVSILKGTNYVSTIKSMTWDTDKVIYKLKSIDGIEYEEFDWLADELIYYTEQKEKTM